MSPALLEVEDLAVTFATDLGPLRAVDGVSWSVAAGETLAIVGESGSGKSVAALTLLGLTRGPRTSVTGRARLGGEELLGRSNRALRRMRGDRIGVVFQDPLSALHPLLRVGDQIAEAVRAHRDVTRRVASSRAVAALERVGIADPSARARSYPHEISGGMRQRAMIAMALVNDPEVLIADEPTTALDVTVQAQVLDLIAQERERRGMAVVLIAHDLGVVAQEADVVAVMYAGRIVERAPARELFARPEHPYTWGLLRSAPRLDGPTGERLEPIAGHPPSPLDRPTGCAFHPRCPYAEPRHREVSPVLEPVREGHDVACLLAPERRARLREEAT